MRTVATFMLAPAAAASALPACQATAAALASCPALGSQPWARQFSGPHGEWDGATAVAVRPSGRTIFVTGWTTLGRKQGYVTVAYCAATGALLWASRYTGPGTGNDDSHSVAVSPSGRTVFVTGASYGGLPANSDYATIAYNASTGRRLWVSRYNGPASAYDNAAAVAVSPLGGTIFIRSFGAKTGEDFATIAYSAGTGAQLWVSRYRSPGNAADAASSLTVSPDGRTVFVTGQSGRSAFATVAYRAATGARLWAKVCGIANNQSAAPHIAVSPNGHTIFVSGTSNGGPASPNDYATVAYNAATGAQEWATSYNGSGGGLDSASSIGVSPAGTRVFVTGTSVDASGGHYATAAYDAASGAQVWVRRYTSKVGGATGAHALAVGPAGTTVYVTGITGYGGGLNGIRDFATVAYRAATGAQLWTRLYSSTGKSWDIASGIAVNPVSGSVYVTGQSLEGAKTVISTVAYRG